MKEIKDLQDKFIKFRDDRDWKQFHTPDNLAKSLTIEATELLENFQWGDENFNLENVKEEIADVFGYLLLLCEHYNFDLIDITNKKIEKNAKKYPVEKAFGVSTKYNKL